MPLERRLPNDEMDELRARVAELENELARAENDGAELAEALARAGQRPQEPCWSCEVKRRWIAVIIGLPLGWEWFRLFPPAMFSYDPLWARLLQIFWGLLVVALPLVCVVIAWMIGWFKRGD